MALLPSRHISMPSSTDHFTLQKFRFNTIHATFRMLFAHLVQHTWKSVCCIAGAWTTYATTPLLLIWCLTIWICPLIPSSLKNTLSSNLLLAVWTGSALSLIPIFLLLHTFSTSIYQLLFFLSLVLSCPLPLHPTPISFSTLLILWVYVTSTGASKINPVQMSFRLNLTSLKLALFLVLIEMKGVAIIYTKKSFNFQWFL